MNFTGKKVLITGGSKGIGLSTAEEFHLLGAEVHITTTTKNKTKFEKFKVHRVDFDNNKSLEDFLSIIANEDYDICINNAGTNAINKIEDTRLEDWEKILKVNLTAPFRVIQAVVPHMKKKKYGKIVNISSIWGMISKAKRLPYSASKFGIRGLTLACAAELAKDNVLINNILPGFTLTELTKKILTPSEMEEIEKQIPAGRMAEPKEIAQVVLFLCSEMNSYISGQDIVVDGGFVNV